MTQEATPTTDESRLRRWGSRALLVIGGALAGTAAVCALTSAGAHADDGASSASADRGIDLFGDASGLLRDKTGVLSDSVDRVRSLSGELLSRRSLSVPTSISRTVNVDGAVDDVGDLVTGDSAGSEFNVAEAHDQRVSEVPRTSESAPDGAGPCRSAQVAPTGSQDAPAIPSDGSAEVPSPAKGSPAAPNAPPAPFAPPVEAPSAPAHGGGPLFAALPVSMTDVSCTTGADETGDGADAVGRRSLRPRSQPGVTPD